MKDNIQINSNNDEPQRYYDKTQIYYDELYLKIQGIKIFCMMIQNNKKYNDYKFGNSECISFWTRFHLLCHFINNDVKKFNNLLKNQKEIKSHKNENICKLLYLNELSYEINIAISKLKNIEKFEISKTLNFHLKRRVYFKYCINDYLNGGDIQLIHPRTTERCEVSYFNGNRVFIFEGKNVVESQITLDDKYQYLINFQNDNKNLYQLATNFIYKYLNKNYIPTVKRGERLMGFDHFCSHRPLKEILMSNTIELFDKDLKNEN